MVSLDRAYNKDETTYPHSDAIFGWNSYEIHEVS